MLDEGAPATEEELFPKRLRNVTIAAVATLLIVVIAAMVWWTRSNLVPSSSPAVASAPELVSIRDGNGALSLTSDGKVDATYHIPPQFERALADSLTTKQVPVPQNIAALPKGYPTSLKRSPGDFRLLSPIGTAVVTDRPVLKWESLADTGTYTVSLMQGGRTVLTSPSLFDTQWETPPLLRGVIYEWRVSATRGSEKVDSAKMPGGPAAFTVLEESEARRLDQLARAYPNSHLLVAVAFAGSGAIERAEDELQTLVRNNPRAYFLKELGANLRPGIDFRK
jgi:hypothetical protein